MPRYPYSDGLQDPEPPGWPRLSQLQLHVAALAGVAVLCLALWVRGALGWWLVLLGVAIVGLGLGLHWRRGKLQAHILAHANADMGTLELLQRAVEQSPDSFLLVDFLGKVSYANQSFLRLTGFQREEVLGKASRDVSSTGLTDLQRAQMREVVEAGGVWRGMLTNRRKDGSEIQESVAIGPVRDAYGVTTHFVELKHDITELLQARQRLTHLLNFDTLTLLPNRWALSSKLEEMIQKSAQADNGEPVYWHAVLILDIDRFSKFNDARGIEWGDALLRAVAQRLVSLLPQSAWAARNSGDEFVVVIENAAMTRTDARMMAYTLAAQLQKGMATQTLMVGEIERVQVTFSIGITVFPFTEPCRKRDSDEHIYRRVSMALHQAKAKGRGQVHAFSEALVEISERKLQVEQGLYEALEKAQLCVYVQKQVDLEGGTAGVETLLRWMSPEKGMVSPAEFIPIAEESDLIIALGEWVLAQAVDMLQHPVLKARGIGVSVNISARQFAQPHFVEQISEWVRGRGIAPGRLTLEVTESTVLADVDDAVNKMTRLSALGVRFALDDFGTGYSSLAYLQRLPIQEIKIDQSFIHSLDPGGNSGALVQALLMVAKSMQLKVVAEGVEDPAQAALLRAWEPSILCQGYLYSYPIPAQEWLDQLAQEATAGS